MKKLFLFILSLTIFTSLLSAQSSTGVLSFFIRSSENGYGIISAMHIKGNAETFSFETDEGGHFVFSTKEGRYDVRTEADGFHFIQTYFVIEAGKNLDVEIFLDPVNKKSLEQVQYSKPMIDGFVVDYSSGMPLKNAAVLMDEKQVAVTDEKGFFSFSSDEYSNIQSPGNKAVRKTFRFSSPGYASFVFEDVLLIPAKITLKVTLKKGDGIETQKNFQRILDGTPEDVQQYEQNQSSHNPPFERGKAKQGDFSSQFSIGCTIPSSIRVGTNCSCTTCSSVQVMSLQYYSESGLDDEWIASWLSASLEAGSIPYRSYGAWYVNNPVDPNFDIASSTCNQVWDGTDVYASTQTAAQVTSGLVLTADGINPARSEYSAENNQGGTSYNCSDCYAGGSGAYSCYSDNICCGYSPAGHGRGMCQWGSQRWAQNGQNYQWIVNHYYIATVGYSLCSQSAPSNLSVTQMNCPNDGVTLSWQNSGSGWYADVSDDSNFSYWWYKDVTNLTSVICPGGFCLYGSPCNPPDYLAFNPSAAYYWRVWDGTAHTYGNSFTTPYCVYTQTSCSGNFDDTGGPSAAYSGNEDYTTIIQPAFATSVTMTFTSFDLELDYDSLWIYDGLPSTTLIGAYTGTASPGTITANTGIMSLRFKADPFVNNAGWTATWTCVSTTGIDEQNNSTTVVVYPNPSNGEFTVYGLHSESQLAIYDVLGQKIFLKTLAGKQETIILNKINSGMYFYKLETENGITATGKLVIE